MSGIYIPGMEMPSGCDNCYFLGEMGICSALLATHRESGLVGDWRWNEFERPPHCPLVPVPEHGDLIGRNPLIDIAMHLRNRAKDEYTKRAIGSVIRYIAEAPTIIEADHIGGVNEMVTDKEGEG